MHLKQVLLMEIHKIFLDNVVNPERVVILSPGEEYVVD